MRKQNDWEGDGTVAVAHAKAMYDLYEAAEDRLAKHQESCGVWCCETCAKLDRLAEDAWDRAQVAEGMCW